MERRNGALVGKVGSGDSIKGGMRGFTNGHAEHDDSDDEVRQHPALFLMLCYACTGLGPTHQKHSDSGEKALQLPPFQQ